MKKYKVYDLYDYKEVLGYADTMQEVKRLARERMDDTDGECCIYYAELNKDTQKYNFSQRKFLEVC